MEFFAVSFKLIHSGQNNKTTNVRGNFWFVKKPVLVIQEKIQAQHETRDTHIVGWWCGYFSQVDILDLS